MVVLPSQVPADPVHRGALPFRSAASHGSYLQGGVWRQTPSRAGRATGRAAAFAHTAERQDHTQGTHYSHVDFSRGKWLFLLCCHYCVSHLCSSVSFMQHKKLTVEGGGTNRDFRKGQKQGDLEIWDPVDDVRCQKHYMALSWLLLKTCCVYLLRHENLQEGINNHFRPPQQNNGSIIQKHSLKHILHLN